jgi:hypothetical protein
MPEYSVPGLAKSAPWLLLHPDSFLPKVDRLKPVLRRPTQTHFIAGPLAKIRSYSTEIEMIILKYYKL